MTIKNHFGKYTLKVIKFQNSKDSLYSLHINCNIANKKQYATFEDSRNNDLIYYSVDFDFKTIDDLSKLKRLNRVEKRSNPTDKFSRFDPTIEKIEFENDSIKNTSITHLTRFDDNSYKKIINEEYYFFEKDDQLICNDVYSIKNYLQNSHNLPIPENQHLKKKYSLVKGKIAFETEFKEIINIDYNFKVKIKE